MTFDEQLKRVPDSRQFREHLRSIDDAEMLRFIAEMLWLDREMLKRALQDDHRADPSPAR